LRRSPVAGRAAGFLSENARIQLDFIPSAANFAATVGRFAGMCGCAARIVA
jgi:hypothetical protein